jgi:putative transposase
MHCHRNSVNRRYAGLMNARRRRTGHFWQGRYGCAVMDEEHLAAAFRYILRNPVTARFVRQPQDWRWSSARAYLEGKRDGLTDTAMMRSRYPAMKSLLLEGSPSVDGIVVRDDESIGRPRGSPRFIKALERRTGRSLAPGKRGPKPQEN